MSKIADEVMGVEPDGARMDGMSLRDWFAGQALSNICGTLTRDEVHDLFHGVKGGAIEARAAYALADAMLAARREPPR